MKIGVVFPQHEFGNDPVAIKDYTQTVEGLGFTHILAYEHIVGANPSPANIRQGGYADRWGGPYTHEHPFHEPFVLYGFMAAITTTLEFATGILILPQRRAQLVAKQAAELDVLSGGRFRLGVGVGWNKVELEAMGDDFHTRGRRTDEQLAVMQALWTKEVVTFKGEWHNFNEVGINPLPVQRPIPIWFGGHAPAVIRRIAKFGAGWMPGFRQAKDATEWLAQLDEALEKEGRSRKEIGIEPRLHYGDATPDQWHTTLTDWRKIGATHASVNTMGCGFTSPEEHIQAVEKFGEAMGIANSG